MSVIVEDFEDESFVVSISGDWSRTNLQQQGGAYSFRSAVVPITGGTSDAILQVPAGATAMQFWYRTSTESGYDFLRVLTDSSQVLEASGETAWTQSAAIAVGEVAEVTFRFFRDPSVDGGENAVYIDDLTFEFPEPPLNSFDGGTHGATVTPANSGGVSGRAFDAVDLAPQFSNIQRHGASGLSLYNPTVSSDARVVWAGLAPVGDTIYARAYVYKVVDRGSFGPLMELRNATDTPSKVWIGNSGRVYIYRGQAVESLVTGPVLPNGQWVRLEFAWTMDSANSGTARLWVYLDPDSLDHDFHQVSNTVVFNGTGKPSQFEFYVGRDTAGYWYLDDIGIAETKLGPAVSSEVIRPRQITGSSQAAHRSATW